MAKKKTTTQDNTPADVELMDENASPALVMAPQDDALQLPSMGSNPEAMLMDRGRTDVELGELFDAEHAGGSLPLITFKRPGQSILGLFVGREEPEVSPGSKEKGREFGLVVLDVVDVFKLKATGDVRASIAGRAQLVESTAIRPYFTKATPGAHLLRLTFRGEVETTRGQSKLKLITVDELKPKTKAAAQ